MRSSRQSSRAQSAEMLACASCRSGASGKRNPPSDVKDNRFAQRQVSRTVAGVALSEAGPGRELLGWAGEYRAESASATRDSMAAAGLSGVLRSSAQVRLERDAAPLPATSAGRGLPAPFQFVKFTGSIVPIDARAAKGQTWSGRHRVQRAWCRSFAAPAFSSSFCGIPKRNNRAEEPVHDLLARRTRAGFLCLSSP